MASEGAPPYDYTAWAEANIIANHPAPAGLEGAEGVAAYRAAIPSMPDPTGDDTDDGE